MPYSNTSQTMNAKGSCDSRADVDDLVNSFLVEARGSHKGSDSLSSSSAMAASSAALGSSATIDTLMTTSVDASVTTTRVGSPMEDLFLVGGTASSMMDCSRYVP